MVYGGVELQSGQKLYDQHCRVSGEESLHSLVMTMLVGAPLGQVKLQVHGSSPHDGSAIGIHTPSSHIHAEEPELEKPNSQGVPSGLVSFVGSSLLI